MARMGETSVVNACFSVCSAISGSQPSWKRESASRSTRCACTQARATSTALVISDSMGSVTLCDWSSMYAGSKPGTRASSASTSSLKIRKSWNGLMEPESRSSSPYLLSLKWKPASLPNWMSRLTIISMFTFGAWCPRSTSESAFGPSCDEHQKLVPQSFSTVE
jgi:hypothetical protein